MTESNKTLNEITSELWEFLRIVGESDALPPLEDVEVRRASRHAGWTVKAYTGGHSDDRTAAEAIAVVRTYAALQGAEVVVSRAYPSSAQPSGTQVAVRTKVVLGGIPVEVLALLDGDAYAEAEPVYAVGPFASLVLGQGVTA